jgi:hypothetical protein
MFNFFIADLFALRALQILQHLLGMAFCFHIIEDVLNLSVRADHEGRSSDSFDDLSIHIFVFDHAK